MRRDVLERWENASGADDDNMLGCSLILSKTVKDKVGLMRPWRYTGEWNMIQSEAEGSGDASTKDCQELYQELLTK